MSSESSTERGAASRGSGVQPWQFYMLLSLAGATWAVIVSRDTHPAALVLLSAAVVAAGIAGAALHYALAGFFQAHSYEERPVTGRTREFLEREKALVLRSIKELEFDRAMKKVGDRDFAELDGGLRARAMEIMQELERAPRTWPQAEARTEPSGAQRKAVEPVVCPSCATPADRDARFCKNCGEKL
jgi:hypothetical protein